MKLLSLVRRPRVKRRASDVAAAAFLAALSAFLHWPELTGKGVTAFVDSSRFFFPQWKWAAAIWREGILPLWNPSLGCGQPFLADPQSASAYFPVDLFFLFLTPVTGFSWLLFSHHTWALLGFYTFARGRRLALYPALFGALAFGFSLHVVCMAWTPVALLTVAWMPWVFWAFDRHRKGRSWGLPALTVASALQLSAGYPVLFYLTALGMILDLFLREKRQNLWRIGRGLAASLGMAVLLNLVWLLPFAEFFQGTDLKEGKYYQPLGLRNLLTALSPFTLGHPLQKGYTGPHYWVATFFAGLPTLVLSLWGAVTRRVRWPTPALWALFLVLSLGETAFLGGVLKKVLPGYSLVIRSGFLLSLVLFYGAWLAAEAFQGPRDPEQPKKDVGVWSAVTIVVYGAAFFSGTPASPAFLTGGILVMAAGWLSWWRLTRLYRVRDAALAAVVDAVRPPLLVLALLLSLVAPVLSLRFLLTPSYYENLPVLLPRMNQAGRIFHSPVVLQKARVLTGSSPEEAYHYAKQWMYPNWPLVFGRDEAQTYNTLQWGPVRSWVDMAFRISVPFSKKAADYLGIRYLFGENSLPGFKRMETGDLPIDLFENPGVYPRWFSVPQAYPAGDPLEDMQRNQNSLFDFSKGCFIADSLKAVPYRVRRVGILNRSPNRLELLIEDPVLTRKGVEASEAGKTLLVSSETAYPGWVLTNDWGKKRIPDVVNHAFLGAVLDEGEMHIVFSFEPATFRLGLFLSLAALAWLAGFAAVLLGRRP